MKDLTRILESSPPLCDPGPVTRILLWLSEAGRMLFSCLRSGYMPKIVGIR